MRFHALLTIMTCAKKLVNFLKQNRKNLLKFHFNYFLNAFLFGIISPKLNKKINLNDTIALKFRTLVEIKC